MLAEREGGGIGLEDEGVGEVDLVLWEGEEVIMGAEGSAVAGFEESGSGEKKELALHGERLCADLYEHLRAVAGMWMLIRPEH